MEPDLTSRLIDEVEALADAATQADGVAPVGEHVLLCLRHGQHPAHHRYRTDPASGALAGYAHVEPDPAGAVAELAVHPGFRRHGHGRALLTEAQQAASAGASLRAWAHGALPAAGGLAAALGYRETRRLWTMRRPLRDPLPEAPLPAGVRLRTFRPGADDAAWLDLNARAFAQHPEQGRWQQSDLQDRIGAGWFDPDGFLIADQDGRMVGYHWTKIDREEAEPVGEVYVVGVDPAAQGRGLGRALTVAGLHWLAEHGPATAMLYVDEENRAARRVYTALGFTRSSTDVMYQSVPEFVP